MKISRLAFCLGVAALWMSLAATGCGGGGGAPSPDGTSGVSGRALITSHAGPFRAGDPPPTPSPYAGTTLAVEPSSGGSEIVRVKTDAKGSFSVSLNPGTYQLVPVLTDLEKISSIVAQPQTFTVKAHQFTTASVAYSQDLP